MFDVDSIYRVAFIHNDSVIMQKYDGVNFNGEEIAMNYGYFNVSVGDVLKCKAAGQINAFSKLDKLDQS